MTAAELLRDLRQLGVGFRVDGDRLLYRPVAKVPPELREDIRRYRSELLRLVHPEAYTALARSELAERCRAAWPWVAEHRPELFDRVMQADQGPDTTDLASLEAAMRAVVEAFEAANPRSGAVSVRFPAIDKEVWIVGDETEALTFEAAIRAEGDERTVFSAAEVECLRDAQPEMLATTERVKRILGGCVRSVGRVAKERPRAQSPANTLAAGCDASTREAADRGRAEPTGPSLPEPPALEPGQRFAVYFCHDDGEVVKVRP